MDFKQLVVDALRLDSVLVFHPDYGFLAFHFRANFYGLEKRQAAIRAIGENRAGSVLHFTGLGEFLDLIGGGIVGKRAIDNGGIAARDQPDQVSAIPQGLRALISTVP